MTNTPNAAASLPPCFVCREAAAHFGDQFMLPTLLTSADSDHLLPDDGVLTGFVLRFSFHTDELNPAGVEGGGDPDLRGWGSTVIIDNKHILDPNYQSI